jgi:two-component system response regulator NreC
MRRVRVFIADDHVLVRDGLRALLERRGDMEVVGEAGDGLKAAEGIEETRPDLVLMDIAMPGLNGVDVTRRIAKSLPRTKILVLSQYDDQEYVLSLLKAGASGYVLKVSPAAELIAAIEGVLRGETVLNPTVAGRVVEGYRGARGERERLPEPPALTAREREVLQLVAEGYTYVEIAARLGISPKTVETHRANIGAKLDIRDLPGLVRYAIRKGMVKADSGVTRRRPSRADSSTRPGSPAPPA